jgi:hypothetical protein
MAVHALLLLVLFQTQAAAPEPELPPVVAELIAPPAPVPAPSSGAPPAAAAPKVEPEVKKPKPPPPQPIKARQPKKPPPPRVRTLAAAPEAEEPEEPVPQVSEAQLAGATRAGTGQGSGSGSGSGKGEGGGSCDMARAIQNALRKDPLVQASVAEARRAGSGKAMLVWNGDWVRSHSQEGRGLSAVREAIIWEVGFASEACRNQPMRGLVMFNLNQSRLVVGKDGWRWSDLLNLRR